MQISALKKLMELIRSSESPAQKSSSEATLESRVAETDSQSTSSVGEGASTSCNTKSDDEIDPQINNLSDEDIITALSCDDEFGISKKAGKDTDGKESVFVNIKEGEHDSPVRKAGAAENNRAHLTSSVPRAARVPMGAITKHELAEMRSIFNNLDDFEIQRLYKKVTTQN